MSLVVADRVYLDASALVAYALGRSGSPDARDQNGAQALKLLIEGDERVAASPITLAESSSVLYTHMRKTEAWFAGFNQPEVNAAETEIMGWIATGALRVRNLGPRAFEMAMSYVSAASREHGRKMKAWDAIHLYEACRWSRESEQQVVIATADSDFTGFLEVFPEFRKHVRLLDTTVP